MSFVRNEHKVRNPFSFSKIVYPLWKCTWKSMRTYSSNVFCFTHHGLSFTLQPVSEKLLVWEKSSGKSSNENLTKFIRQFSLDTYSAHSSVGKIRKRRTKNFYVQTVLKAYVNILIILGKLHRRKNHTFAKINQKSLLEISFTFSPVTFNK